ncbi:MAG: hypothetical protein ABIQ98_04470 [Sphingomicrobium sp.]
MLFLMMLAAAAAPEGKTMAMDDWTAMTITHVAASDGGESPLYLRVQAADLDGDGVADQAVVKLSCDGAGSVSSAAYQVISPRDLATGQASGKRMHKPFVVTKEWGASSPQLSALKPTYDVKSIKSVRVAAGGDWTPITLASTDGVCAATLDSAARVTKTRSNIQNN